MLSADAESRILPATTLALDFDRAVPHDGYAWWYVDALSEDGRHGITIIAMLGCVFSPAYARARRRGPAEPLQHCAMNVAIYGPGRRWALSEYGAAAVHRDATRLTIGTSSLSWDGHALVFELDEIAAPLPAPIRGRLRLVPQAPTAAEFALDAAGLHRWRPLAPAAHVEVTLRQPALCWNGKAYLDCNHGAGPLEDAFAGWHWSRAALPDGGAALLYDVTRRDGSESGLALRVRADGAVQPLPGPARHVLPITRWRVARATRSESESARVVQTLEDTPFYARSIVATTLCGHDVHAMHESLSLDRFSATWVQCLLPFRIRRSGA